MAAERKFWQPKTSTCRRGKLGTWTLENWFDGMPPEFLALIETPLPLIAALFVGVFIGMTIEKFLFERRRQAWRERNRWRWAKKRGGSNVPSGPWVPPVSVSPKQPDAADQLRIVMGANFTIQPLLNKNEARVFKEVDRFVIDCNPAWQVMAQVSLGEILRCKDKDAYGCINAKRVDLLLVDGDCLPRHAIEYQGGAHHQGTAAARDAVKKEALRRAGIGYSEVVAGQTTPAELKQLVKTLLSKAATLG